MEGERKGNTAMLTVIAIATLLVAVVGATFAYFSANTTDTNGTVTVQAQTAAADVFTITGNGNIGLTITADEMQAGLNADAIADTANNNSLQTSLTAGSSVATCTYDLIYTPDTTTTGYYAFENSQTGKIEFGLSGTSSNGTNSFSETDISGDQEITLGHFTTSDPADPAAATTETWTLTVNFHNLKDTDQTNNAANKTFGGTVSATNVSCTNAAPAQQGSGS